MSRALPGKCALKRLATRPLHARGQSRPNAVKPHSSALSLERGLQGLKKNPEPFYIVAQPYIS